MPVTRYPAPGLGLRLETSWDGHMLPLPSRDRATVSRYPPCEIHPCTHSLWTWRDGHC
jgi:hypothetical protein